VATLKKPGNGHYICDYLSIQDSTATTGSGTGGGTWFAGVNSVNVSNNTGWIFGIPGTRPQDFFEMF